MHCVSHISWTLTLTLVFHVANTIGASTLGFRRTGPTPPERENIVCFKDNVYATLDVPPPSHAGPWSDARRFNLSEGKLRRVLGGHFGGVFFGGGRGVSFGGCLKTAGARPPGHGGRRLAASHGRSGGSLGGRDARWARALGFVRRPPGKRPPCCACCGPPWKRFAV